MESTINTNPLHKTKEHIYINCSRDNKNYNALNNTDIKVKNNYDIENNINTEIKEKNNYDLENGYEFSDDDEVYSSDEIEQINNETVRNKIKKQFQDIKSYINSSNIFEIIKFGFEIMFLIVYFCCAIMFELIILFYTEKKHGDIHCSTEIVHPYTWLIVYIFTNIAMKLPNFIYKILKIEKPKILTIITNIIKFFIYIWTVIGSLMFFRDCNGHLPKDINELYHAVLIISYIHIGITIGENSKKQENQGNQG